MVKKRLFGTAARWLVVALLGAVVTLTACGGDDSSSSSSGGGGSSDGPIKIGVIHPFSGDFAAFANDIARGYELAIQDHGGEAGGREIELIRGDAMTPEEGISETQRLLTQEDVDLFTGTYISSVAAAASETAARNDKVYWENHSLDNDLTDRGMESFIRVAPKAETFATISADFIAGDLAKSLGKDISGLKVFIEHEDSVYGTSVAEGQEKALTDAGADVTVGAHSAAAADLTDSVLRAKGTNPDVWLMTGYVPDVNLLLRQADEQSFHPAARVLTATGDSDETLDAVGADSLAGTFVVQYSNPDTDPEFAPGWQKFLKEYKAKFGEEPLGGVSMVGYTGLTVLLQAIDAADGDTSVGAIHDAALGFDVPVTGLPNGWGAKFDENGQNERAALLVGQWHKNGTLPTVYPKEASVAPIETGK